MMNTVNRLKEMTDLKGAMYIVRQISCALDRQLWSELVSRTYEGYDRPFIDGK